MTSFDFSLGGAEPIEARSLAQHCQSIRTLGYTVVRDFLDAAICAGLKALLQSLLDSYVPPATAQGALDRHLMHDPVARNVAFGRLLEDARLQQLLAPFVGDFWIMYAFTSSSLPPRGSNYGRRIHVDCPRFIPGYVSNMGLIWALDDFDEATGGTEVLPGSHHVPEAPSDALFEAGRVTVRCPAGSLIVFSGRLFHRSGQNSTGRWRHALTMNACRPYMKQRMDWVRLVPESLALALNDQARRLIGYDTRLPTRLEEFFVPEDQRLYKSGQG